MKLKRLGIKSGFLFLFNSVSKYLSAILLYNKKHEETNSSFNTMPEKLLSYPTKFITYMFCFLPNYKQTFTVFCHDILETPIFNMFFTSFCTLSDSILKIQIYNNKSMFKTN